jgi:hypothetical protein
MALSAGLAVLVFGLPRFAGASTIDTTPGNTAINAWGPTGTVQYGQVITVPTAESFLNSFGLTFNEDNTFSFHADIAAWNGTQAIGPLLFSSAQTTTDIGAYHTYNINTGGLVLDPGAQYVLFFDAYGGGTGRGFMKARSDNPYSGGMFVYSNNDTSQLTTGPWVLYNGSYDAAFTAEFSAAAPLPSSVWGGLVLLGGLGMTTLARRRLAISK